MILLVNSIEIVEEVSLLSINYYHRLCSRPSLALQSPGLKQVRMHVVDA